MQIDTKYEDFFHEKTIIITTTMLLIIIFINYNFISFSIYRRGNPTGLYKNYQTLLVVFIICIIAISSESLCNSNPCMYGICVDNYNSSSLYSCYCIDGYTGINCEINWDDCWSNPCLNGGICSDAVAAYNCTCTDGFIGLNCDERFDECLYTPCLNNGTCINFNGFMCQCPDGYSGKYCEIDASVCNNTICKNSGECIEGPGLLFSCQCTDGWTGELCEKDIDECLASPCENGGLCINIPATYTCACLFGFTGKNCDKSIVPCEVNVCENNAVCLLEDNQTVCYCVPDYHGSLCELRYDDCEAKFAMCNNGGTCIDGINSFTCSCPLNYYGQTCADYSSMVTSEEIPYSSLGTPTISAATLIPFQATSTYSTKSDSTPDVTSTKLIKLDTEEAVESTVLFSSTKTVVPTSTIASTREDFLLAWTTIKTLFSSSPITEDSHPLITYTANSSEVSSVTDEQVVQKSTTSPSLETDLSFATTDETTPTDENIITTSSTETPNQIAVNMTMKPIRVTTKLVDQLSTMTSEKIETHSSFPFSRSSTDSYTLGTETFFNQSSPTGISISTERQLTIYNCTQEQCDHNITCQNSATECNCNYPDGCIPSPDILNAAFNGKSYIRQYLAVDKDGKVRIFIRLKTQSKNGILVHAFFDDDRYILLHMEVGQLKFQFSCGLQTMLLGEIDSPINNGYDVDIEMRFQYMKSTNIDKCSAMLFVNDTLAMSGEQVVSTQDDIPQQAKLHLGGIPLAFSHYFPHVAVGFIGCMSMLKINEIHRHLIRDAIDSFQIEECTSFLCLANPCKNFGACQETDGKISCNCMAGYTGEVCERAACDDNPCHYGASCITSPGTGFMCICPLGTHGLLCDEDIIIVQPSFTVFTPGLSSYIAYGLIGSIKESLELKLRFIPQSVEQISLIAYIGQSGPYRDLSDHLAITYVRGYIMLTWDLGSGVRRIFTNTALTTKMHRPHTLRVGRKGKDAWLSIDGLGNVTGRSAGSMSTLDAAPILWIGGHRTKNFETLPHDLPLHTGFFGCIFDVELRIENKIYPVAKTNSATGRGIGECHRNECTHRSCKNGAVCLNHGPTYSCVCTKDWEGPDCSKPTSM
ncbi:protein eyes shut isoform X3 [Neodiprion pinetum]|uniref:protein eyes shut isoform X3 n=1 Tax=Neodiprion pinetum TaxID=441929 RepID=UPI0037131ACE